MPAYTDSPIGSFLQQLGIGIPQLANAHRQRGLQDEALALDKRQAESALTTQGLNQALLRDKVEGLPADSAREQYKFAESVDPLGAFMNNRDVLQKAGVNMPADYIPPDKAMAIQRQQFITKLMSGNGNAAESGYTPDMLARIRDKFLFPNIDPNDLRGPVNEPNEHVATVENGIPGERLIPRSQVGQAGAGAFYPSPPTPAERATSAKTGNMQQLAQELEMSFNPAWVGPAAGRIGQFKQLVPGNVFGAIDPKQAEFYAANNSLRNQLLYARSGAAITDSEFERMNKELPKPEDPPEVWRASMAVTKRNFEDIQARVLGQKPRAGATPVPGMTQQPSMIQQPQAGLDAKLAKYAQMRGISLEQARAMYAQIR